MQVQVKKALAALEAGQLLLYPTDTIWGIGCDALNEQAIKRVYTLKQRDDHKQLILLLANVAQLKRYVEVVPSTALELIQEGDRPTTIIYEGVKNLPALLTGEAHTIAIRITSDPFCQALIEAFDRPIVSTSANISGAPSPTNFTAITATIKQGVDHIVDWRQEETAPSQPSRIVKLEPDGSPTFIRV